MGMLWKGGRSVYVEYSRFERLRSSKIKMTRRVPSLQHDSFLRISIREICNFGCID